MVRRNVERLALEDPRPLEFLELIDFSSRMDVAQTWDEIGHAMVKRGSATMEFAR